MTFQEIKHLFFSFRNGIVAKAFLDAEAPYKTIFGLQLPQIAEIARNCGKDNGLAKQLWEDQFCRESRLLACRLFETDIQEEEAYKIATEVKTREEADYLAFALLKFLPYAKNLGNKLISDGFISDIARYCGRAVLRNLA